MRISDWSQTCALPISHHTASAVALVGGGGEPRPGEISLAHNGVLFLDELPEWERRALEVLREPLESGVVTISRAARQSEFPARFQIGRAHVRTPVTNAHLVCRLLLETKKTKTQRRRNT